MKRQFVRDFSTQTAKKFIVTLWLAADESVKTAPRNKKRKTGVAVSRFADSIGNQNLSSEIGFWLLVC